jgi:hypothetical protein
MILRSKSYLCPWLTAGLCTYEYVPIYENINWCNVSKNQARYLCVTFRFVCTYECAWCKCNEGGGRSPQKLRPSGLTKSCRWDGTCDKSWRSLLSVTSGGRRRSRLLSSARGLWSQRGMLWAARGQWMVRGGGGVGTKGGSWNNGPGRGMKNMRVKQTKMRADIMRLEQRLNKITL